MLDSFRMKVLKVFKQGEAPAKLVSPVSDGSALVPVMVLTSWEREAKRRELVSLVEEEGVALPMSIEQILEVEDRGGIVDIRTGEIFYPEE